MGPTNIYKKFSHGIMWNGIFYTFYKALSVMLSFTFYATLSTQQFGQWAGAKSLVYIIILWLDCGFKKSIPRYCPVFAKNKHTHRLFIQSILSFQSLLLVTIGTLFLWNILTSYTIFQHITPLRRYVLILFVSKGMVAVFRSLYHAQFKQKEFNLLFIGALLLETLSCFLLLFFFSHHLMLIQFILLASIVSSFFVVIGSFLLLPTLYLDKEYKTNKEINLKITIKNFISHSAVMWAGSFVKSFSERNILFPYLTATIGMINANGFKIAHEAALFFQRVAITVLGIADTSLLAHVQENTQSKHSLESAFSRLYRYVIIVCLALLVFMGISLYLYPTVLEQSDALSIFLIVALGYLIEIFLSPYERILETKQDYKLLWIAYTPYLVTIAGCLSFNVIFYYSLILFIGLLHGARLSGALLMTIFAHKKYQLPYPKIV